MRNQKNSIKRGKMIHIEKKFHNTVMFLGDKISRIILLVILLIIDFFLILLLFIGDTSLSISNAYFLILDLGLIIICTTVLLSMKIVYLTIYENGINYPPVFFSILRKDKFFHCNDIIKIYSDEEKRDLIVKLKSGKEYRYNSYFISDHIYPIIKVTFKRCEHIEFDK